MGYFSVTLNVITILIVFSLFYIGYNIYRTREDKNMTAPEVFNQLMFDPATVSHAYMANANLGPIGDFGSYEWDTTDFSTPIEE
jgi:hypothetical protein